MGTGAIIVEQSSHFARSDIWAARLSAEPSNIFVDPSYWEDWEDLKLQMHTGWCSLAQRLEVGKKKTLTRSTQTSFNPPFNPFHAGLPTNTIIQSEFTFLSSKLDWENCNKLWMCQHFAQLLLVEQKLQYELLLKPQLFTVAFICPVNKTLWCKYSLLC